MVDIDSRQSIIAIVFLAVVGPCVFILQPGFVQGLIEYVGFSEQQAGLIASVEMFGLATTTVLLSFISSKVAWRKFNTVCIVICTAGNLISIGQTESAGDARRFRSARPNSGTWRVHAVYWLRRRTVHRGSIARHPRVRQNQYDSYYTLCDGGPVPATGRSGPESRIGPKIDS